MWKNDSGLFRAGSAAVLAVTLCLGALFHFAPEQLGGAVGQDAQSICGGGRPRFPELDGLPGVVAVNWGQWKGPYSLPPERVVLCANRRAWLYTRQTHLGWPAKPRQLPPREAAQLFGLLLSAWPRGEEARGKEDGNFLWVLDSDYNLIIAPVMQEREPGSGPEEVKHGDLVPGQTFFGRNAESGPYRGVARMGGEFNLAGRRDGMEWLMHAKSGYTAYRVPLANAARYYHDMRQAGKNELSIARNFQRCVNRDLFRARTPLTRVLCYMRRGLGVEAALGFTQQCDIRNTKNGGLPNLAECTPKEPGDSVACAAEDAAPPGGSRAVVHLVDWYSPGQDRCDRSIGGFTALLQTAGQKVRNFANSHQMVARTAGGKAYAKSVSNEIRALRKHSCLYTPSFSEQLRCNVHGCFAEGFTQQLKDVERALAEGDDVERLWDVAMNTWSECQSAEAGQELLLSREPCGASEKGCL